MKSLQLTCASVLCIFSLACGAVDTTQKIPIPNEVRSFVGPTDTLLAYQKMDLFGDGNIDAVIIVRHQIQAPAERNTCDLIVLQSKSDALVVMDKSNNVVDCKYNNFAKYIAKNYYDLNEYLKLKPLEITYDNVKARGRDSYSFKFSKEKQTWYTSKADISYPRSNDKTDSVEIVNETASYPKDFGWIPLSAFRIDDVQGALNKNKTVIK